MRTLIIIFSLLFLFNATNGQSWEKIYGLSGRFDAFQNLTESYDSGFLVLGATDYFPDTRGLLIKTDLNGNILYQIQLGIENINDELNLPFSIDNTVDGGSIICTAQGPSYLGDIGIIKLDACGDLEWCKVFRTDDDPDWGVEIKQLSDGGYIMLTFQYGYYIYTPRIHLFRFDSSGELLWIEPYALESNYPLMNENMPEDIVVTPEEDFFISGHCYWCDEPLGSGGVHTQCRIKSLAIMADSSRYENWLRAYEADDTLSYSLGGWSTQYKSGSFYVGAIDESIWPYKPRLLKYDYEGNLIHDSIVEIPMLDNKIAEGFMVNPSFTSDGRLFTCMSFVEQLNTYPGLFGLHELDSIGGWHNSIMHPSAHAPVGLIVTSDDKLLAGAVVGSELNQDIILMKFNTNLEYDSIYTAPREYDYLCPEPIVSKTIDLSSCEVIVDVKDIPTRKEYEARVSLIPITPAPSPAGDYVRFLLENTEYHTKIRVVCYDIQGRQLTELPVNSGIHETGLDVSRWLPGMYMAVVYAGNKQMGKARFVVE